MSQLFGFQINRKEGQRGQSPVPPSAEDPVAVAAGGYYGTYVDTDNQARNEFEMIRRYRDMAIHPEVDSAVDEVVNEFIYGFVIWYYSRNNGYTPVTHAIG